MMNTGHYDRNKRAIRSCSFVVVDKEETRRSFGRNIRSVTIDELGARKARRVFTIVKKAKTPKS